MSQPNGLNPVFDTVYSTTQTLTAAAAESSVNTIQAGKDKVDVTGVTNDANDFIVLPALASVPNGFTITIACIAGSNFELRTPAASNEKINNEDSDGTKEYLCTSTDTLIARKVSNTVGWSVQSITNLGAVRTAVIPD